MNVGAMDRRIAHRIEVSEKLNTGEYHLKIRKLLRSGVWRHFARVYNGEQALNFTCCMHCQQIYPYAHKSGTSAMLKHKCVKQFAVNNGSGIAIVNKGNSDNEDPDFDEAACDDDMRNSTILDDTTSAFAAYVNSYPLDEDSPMDNIEAAIVVTGEDGDVKPGASSPDQMQNVKDQIQVSNDIAEYASQKPVTEQPVPKRAFDPDDLPYEILPSTNLRVYTEIPKRDRCKTGYSASKADDLRELQKKKLIAEIKKINAETEYWKAMTLKVNERAREMNGPPNTGS